MPTQLPQLVTAPQLSQHASGLLRQYSSSGQSPARQGSLPQDTDLITQGLRGSQIAQELQAADRAQAAAAAGLLRTAVAQGAGMTPPPLPLSNMPGPGAAHLAMLPGQTVVGGFSNQGTLSTPPQPGTAALAEGLTQAAVASGMILPGGGQQQPARGLSPSQQAMAPGNAAQVYGGSHGPPTAPAVGLQGGPTDGQAPAAVDGTGDMPNGSVSPLASPTLGLKLGQAHSPGLSEDALGGDQEFMDAMQAISGGCFYTRSLVASDQV